MLFETCFEAPFCLAYTRIYSCVELSKMQDNYFQFNGRFYRQTFGTSMGIVFSLKENFPEDGSLAVEINRKINLVKQTNRSFSFQTQ
jgi:hypothetical protein